MFAEFGRVAHLQSWRYFQCAYESAPRNASIQRASPFSPKV
jgi:hypothetical protein